MRAIKQKAGKERPEILESSPILNADREELRRAYNRLGELDKAVNGEISHLIALIGYSTLARYIVEGFHL